MLVFNQGQPNNQSGGFALLEALLATLILSVVTTATLRSLALTAKTLSYSALRHRIGCTEYECPPRNFPTQNVTCRCRQGDTSDSALILP